MKLLHCYIENFGGLSSFEYNFKDGLNVIAEENGFGKTTFTVFIKAMLYGLDANKQKGEETERKRYAPWQGGRFGGSLVFETAGNIYRIERSFAQKPSSDTLKLYNAKNGREIDAISEKIGEDLFGIDADGFERTVFISERNLSVKNNNPTVSAKLSNLVGVDGDMGNFDDAIEKLEKMEKQLCLRRGKGGLVWDIKNDITELKKELADIERRRSEYEAFDTELSLLREKIKAAEAKKASLEKRRLSLDYEKEYKRKAASISVYDERLRSLKEFFKFGFPSKEEIAIFEGKEIEATALFEAAQKNKGRIGKPLDAISEKIKAYVSAVSKEKDKKNANKSLHIWIFSAIAALAAGIVFGAFVSKILYTACLLSPFFAFLWFFKSRKAKLSKKPSQLLDDALEFCKTYDKNASSPTELYGALLEINAQINEEMKARERLICETLEKEERAKRLTLECESFLSKFPTNSEEPFSEIRQRLSDFENLCAHTALMRSELKGYAKERGLNPQAINESLDDDSIEAALQATEADIKLLKSEYYTLETKQNLLFEEISRTDELMERNLELSDALKEAELSHKVTVSASRHLTLAKERLTSKYLSKTRAAFNSYIKEIGGENSDAFTLDTDFSLKKTENGLTNPGESYSLGTRELYSLAIRLALSDALFPDEAPFIILDDPFCHFDDKKCLEALNATLRISKKKQIIYLTCSRQRCPK